MSTTLRTWLALSVMVAVWGVIAGWSIAILGGLAPNTHTSQPTRSAPGPAIPAAPALVLTNTTAPPHAH